ncbi:hypothetical protein ABZ215_25070 [Amycolatopsis sp. NPDC006131]|uniref:hypothetical protein n=1 Tax=Amycolatopsis sp. NPDC006131 TaxID=3156731 RepID=UPI0033BA730E
MTATQMIPPRTWTLLDQHRHDRKAWVFLDSETAGTVTFKSRTLLEFGDPGDDAQWMYTVKDPADG